MLLLLRIAKLYHDEGQYFQEINKTYKYISTANKSVTFHRDHCDINCVGPLRFQSLTGKFFFSITAHCANYINIVNYTPPFNFESY